MLTRMTGASDSELHVWSRCEYIGRELADIALVVPGVAGDGRAARAVCGTVAGSPSTLSGGDLSSDSAEFLALRPRAGGSITSVGMYADALTIVGKGAGWVIGNVAVGIDT